MTDALGAEKGERTAARLVPLRLLHSTLVWPRCTCRASRPAGRRRSPTSCAAIARETLYPGDCVGLRRRSVSMARVSSPTTMPGFARSARASRCPMHVHLLRRSRHLPRRSVRCLQGSALIYRPTLHRRARRDLAAGRHFWARSDARRLGDDEEAISAPTSAFKSTNIRSLKEIRRTYVGASSPPWTPPTPRRALPSKLLSAASEICSTPIRITAPALRPVGSLPNLPLRQVNWIERNTYGAFRWRRVSAGPPQNAAEVTRRR